MKTAAAMLGVATTLTLAYAVKCHNVNVENRVRFPGSTQKREYDRV